MKTHNMVMLHAGILTESSGLFKPQRKAEQVILLLENDVHSCINL